MEKTKEGTTIASMAQHFAIDSKEDASLCAYNWM